MKWGSKRCQYKSLRGGLSFLGGFPVFVLDNLKNPWIYVEGGKSYQKAIGGCNSGFLICLISLPSTKEEEQ